MAAASNEAPERKKRRLVLMDVPDIGSGSIICCVDHRAISPAL